MTDSYHMGFKNGQQSLIDQGYEKVRHGRWEIVEGSTGICSICGDVGYTFYNYCPNCGSRMMDEE